MGLGLREERRKRVGGGGRKRLWKAGDLPCRRGGLGAGCWQEIGVGCEGRGLLWRADSDC